MVVDLVPPISQLDLRMHCLRSLQSRSLPVNALCPMTAEYLSAGLACQGNLHWYQFLDDLGWPVLAPVVLTLDINTAIS